MSHCLERTSPKGERFVGRCVLCGEENLTLDDLMREPCPKEVSNEEAVLRAVEGEEES